MSEAAKRTLRTVLQTAVGLCVLLPTVVDAAGLPGTLPWVAGALTAAAGVTRLMALPAVQALLPGWLRTNTPVNGDARLLSLAHGEGAEGKDA
ncbi:hypothetical protein B6E66_31585 [Streptomyces maremycinicus]|uniref:hypothetical protein n=1 Tax=Streptomyces maremycinicus TaxID=1679753 RepID=UPI000788E46F|nr:hypothetical protein [Streptomyces sp. NBRC 110468]OQR60192.1 hypothetical protein B6E66_31585 [Streptomyces sp. B9173]